MAGRAAAEHWKLPGIEYFVGVVELRDHKDLFWGAPGGGLTPNISEIYITEIGWLSNGHADQALQFDITLAGNNEYGAAMAMRIYGVEILNEGSGVSIDDAVTEMQATFVARYVQPWHIVTTPFARP